MEQHNPDAVVQAERNTWNRTAGSYQDDATELTGHAIGLLIELAGVSAESIALEVGCGPGHVAHRLAETGARVVGVDLAPEMIKVARNQFPALEFHEANAEQLPFEEGSFDAVLVNFTIHHFARPALACAEIRRVLRPGGRFVFAGPIEQLAFGAFITGLMTHHTMDVLPHGPIYMGATGEDYKQLVQDAGFSDFDVSVRPLTLHLESLDPLFRIGWTMCELDKLPEQTQNRIRASVMDNAEPYRTAEGFVFPDQIVVGVATKQSS